MSEAIEQATTQALPLEDKHREHGAEFAGRDGWLVPASYGATSDEYSFVRDEGAGLIDLSPRGRIIVSGTEAVPFLNGLITNDVKALEPGGWMAAAFPNVQGRLQAFVRLINQDNKYLIDTEAVTHERVHKLLERFTLAGDFQVEDVTSETAQLSLQGARAAQTLDTVLGHEVYILERGHAVSSLEWQDNQVTIIRATHTSEDGFDLFALAKNAPALWDALVGAGARPVGYDALEILRIEAGVPRYRVDMDENTVVLETGLDDAVSFTKGCYIGQEIIARIHWRGHVAKKLTGLSLDGIVEIPRESKIKTTDGKEIGRITSSTVSPRLNQTIALGYLKYDYLAPGTEVLVAVRDESHAARVNALPFVRGSWYESATETEGEQ